MTKLSILSGTLLEILEDKNPGDCVDAIEIVIKSLDPFRIRTLFSNADYKGKDPGPGSFRTALDIDCSWNVDHAMDTHIEVTMKLDSLLENVEFLPGLALTAGSHDTRGTLRNLTMVDGRTIVFHVKKDQNTVAGPLPYNIGLLFTDWTDPDIKMPAIYDPKVKNEG